MYENFVATISHSWVAKHERHDDYSITLSQENMLPQLYSQVLLGVSGPNGNVTATSKQATAYRHIIGKMLYIGRSFAPLVLLHASMAATNLSDLRTHPLQSLSSVVMPLKAKEAKLLFLSPIIDTEHTKFTLNIISGGVMANASEKKTGGISTLPSFWVCRSFDTVVCPMTQTSSASQWDSWKTRSCQCNAKLPLYSRTAC